MQSSLPRHLCALLKPQAYPHPVGEVQLIETHISWVLLAGEFAYKIKRPVDMPSSTCAIAERRNFSARRSFVSTAGSRRSSTSR